MAIIQINNLSFTYEGGITPVFEDENIQIDSQWKLGLIGRNGRGKTTLLKILMNELPFQGEIISSDPFKYFPYDIRETSQLAYEVCEKYEPASERWMIEKELSLLEVDIDILNRPLETLSMGERSKLQLAMLFSVPDFFLLIDEPTNHLDEKGRREVAFYLQNKEGFIVASHDRGLLDQVTDHTLAINQTHVEVIKGNYTIWKEQFDRQNLFEERQNQTLAKDIKRLEKAYHQSKNWSDATESSKYRKKGAEKVADRGFIGGKSAKMMKKAKTLEKRQQAHIEEKSSLMKNMEATDTLFFHHQDYYQSPYVTFKDFEVFYDGDNKLHQPINATVEIGDRLFIKGANGAGKTSILKLLLGEYIPYAGFYHIENNLSISYVSQDTRFLKGNLESWLESFELDKTLFLTLLRKMGFPRDAFEKPLESISDGQKKKILLGKSLSESAHLYIWDEPLNFIDIETRIQLETAILFSQPTMIIIEHDQLFQHAIETKSIDLKPPIEEFLI